MSSPEWSLRQSILCLVGSTLVTLILSLGGYFLWKRDRQNRLGDENYRIASIVQTGPEKEALKTAYLAELLSLSADRPQSIYAFDLKKGEARLLASPLIRQAKIKRLPPATLYVDYEVRKPVAWLADYHNTGIDREGYLFPMSPFFSPKQLPEIYLGLPPFGSQDDRSGRKGGEWLAPLHNKHLSLAFEILQYLEGTPWKEGLVVKRIDVSNAFAASLGQREIVLFTEEELNIRQNEREIVFVFPKILRLAPKEYAQQLGNFFALRRTMMDDYRRQIASADQSSRFSPRIVDLRIPQLAFVQK